MVCEVFVAISSDDVSNAIERVTENDIILSDVFCPEHTGKTVEAIFKDASDPTLVSKVSNWFNDQSFRHGFSFGYANAFYQSCIRPLSGYICGIDEILAVEGKEHVVFVLPVSLIWKRRTSNYFLAEYESAGVNLYDRHSVLLPYIEDYLIANQLTYKGGKRKLALQYLIYNPLRLWVVFLARMARDLSASIKKSSIRDERLIIRSPDELFIIRTVGQAITIIPYLRLTKKNILLVIGTSFTDDGPFRMLTRLLGAKENITIVRAVSPSFDKIFLIYLKAFKNIFSCRESVFPHKGINIKFSQALREIIAMNAGLNVYRMQIRGCINEFTPSFIFSLEQKSAHAYVDAELAKMLKAPSAQIQWCQQAFFDIPNPVSADFFLCETPKIQECFENSWTKHTERLRYIGSLQGITTEETLEFSRKNCDVSRICLFLGVEAFSNRALLKYFSEFTQLNNLELLVKLHPRDGKCYSSLFPDAKYFTSYESDFLDFSKNFDVAITFPSGVISDLIYARVPFLVYIPEDKEYQNTESEYLPDGLEPMTSIASIFDSLKNIEELVCNHECILTNFIKDNALITDIESIELNLGGLVDERTLKSESKSYKRPPS